MNWYEGGVLPHRPIELDSKITMPSTGLMLICEKGVMLTGCSGGKVCLWPENQFCDFRTPPKILTRSIGHY